MKRHRLLSHSYRLIHQSVSTKDVVLKKKFSGSLTTEQFLEIDSQPKNTCPMIDPVQTNIEKQIEPLIDICDMDFADLRYNEECSHCSNADVYNSNQDSAREAQKDAENFKDQLEEAKQYLEVLRSDCERLRDHGLKIKGCIWSIPEVDDLDKLRTQIMDLINSAPDAEFSSKKYYSYFPEGEKVSSFSVEQFNTCENESCCFHGRMLNEIENFAERTLPTSTIREEDCSDAIDNYDRISEWVIYLGEKALELIDDTEAVQRLKDKNDINAFVAEYQRDFDSSYVSSWFGMKMGELATELDKVEDKIKKLLPDWDENETLEYLILKDILYQLRLKSAQIEELSIKTQLIEHQQATRKVFDEFIPKIEAVRDMAYAPIVDGKMQFSNKNKHAYYMAIVQTCNELRCFKLLNSYSTYQSFIIEEL
jgi:hypothetical protein